MSDRADDTNDGDYFRCDFCGINYHVDETPVKETSDGHRQCGFCKETDRADDDGADFLHDSAVDRALGEGMGH